MTDPEWVEIRLKLAHMFGACLGYIIGVSVIAVAGALAVRIFFMIVEK